MVEKRNIGTLKLYFAFYVFINDLGNLFINGLWN